MREILIETKTSDNRKRRHLCMTEIINDKHMVARSEKRYAYYITERDDPVTKENIESWVDDQAKIKKQKPRHVTIRRTFNKDSGVGQTLYRTTGSFYVVRNFKIYAVVFLHSIKFDVLKSAPGTI